MVSTKLGLAEQGLLSEVVRWAVIERRLQASRFKEWLGFAFGSLLQQEGFFPEKYFCITLIQTPVNEKPVNES